MKVKEFNPRYEKIELLRCIKNEYITFIGIITWELVKHKYGNYKILHVFNYDEVKTTSMIISRERKII